MDMAKVVHVVSGSEEGFDDAVRKGVARAAKTIRNIHGVKVTDMTCNVKDDKVTHYKVSMEIAFRLEGNE